ncbi:MAG: glycosyltransferase [Chromatiales bacterium]
MPLRVLSLVLHSFETDSRVLRACNSLISAGYAVTVGALHESSLPERQKIGDIDVKRVRLRTRVWSKWRPIQFIKYFEWAIRVAWRFRDNDIIHCNDINTLPAGTLLKALTGGRARVVYDAHEFESNHKAGQSALSIRLMQLLEGFFIRFADKVVTVSDSIADEYARIYKIERPDVVLNVPWLQTVSSDDRFRRRFGIRPDQTIFLTQYLCSEITQYFSSAGRPARPGNRAHGRRGLRHRSYPGHQFQLRALPAKQVVRVRDGRPARHRLRSAGNARGRKPAGTRRRMRGNFRHRADRGLLGDLRSRPGRAGEKRRRSRGHL